MPHFLSGPHQLVASCPPHTNTFLSYANVKTQSQWSSFESLLLNGLINLTWSGRALKACHTFSLRGSMAAARRAGSPGAPLIGLPPVQMVLMFTPCILGGPVWEKARPYL
ncbi:hypothetical protein JZ751_001440 [Albula glossodonta]|uniref:Uncharacterized protein n=1 Tax=Albula glossodonta TaxID=121402 RepID=A0A8T2PTH4_9TELE|nr:hypothetical protein JZ751_001440 [Albula glossodonta]